MRYKRDRDWTNKKPDGIEINGRIKCIGYQLSTNGHQFYKVDGNAGFYDYGMFENALCNMEEEVEGIRNHTGPRYDENCWNNSKTFNNRSYQVSFLCQTRCISKYRVKDGIFDCFENEESKTINNSCSQIQRHRLQCSSSELTCLLVGALGDWFPSCSNGRDEFDDQSGTLLYGNTICEKNTDRACAYLRTYVQTSSENHPNKVAVVSDSLPSDESTTTIPFRLYCNSFFDTKTAFDESADLCEKWICLSDEYQCLSGQCISQYWLCDGKYILLIVSLLRFTFVLAIVIGEWDCSDGSDEERLFIMDNLNEHNSKMMNLTKLKQQCHQQYPSNNTPFSDLCDLSFEYPCFRTGADDVLNVKLNRPCIINLTQIGDGKTDCLTGLDERNRLQCSDRGMLGFHFQFNDSLCMQYNLLCDKIYQWKPGANVNYDAVCFHRRNISNNSIDSNCNTLNDVMCLNDTCIKNARCNGQLECSHGEDEYRCVPPKQSPLKYRVLKESWLQWLFQSAKLRLRHYPPQKQLLKKFHPSLFIQNERNNPLYVTPNLESDEHMTRVFGMETSKVKTVYEVVRDSLDNGNITFENDYLPFICNRGVAVKYYTGHTVCFCPPSFYGSQCQYYSDRIIVATHLDLNNSQSFANEINVIKVLTTFLFEEEIIDYYEFHVDPQTQIDNKYIKQQIYFLYPRQQEYLHMKRNNRSGTQLYSVRFEAFNLDLNENIQIIGIWKYSIYFDFLPSFRLSKILRFPSQVSSFLHNPCLNHSCSQNGTCQKIINSNSLSYFCSCKSGSYGNQCEHYAEECDDYCSPKSVCKPKYRGILTGNVQHPLCLCPVLKFGNRCYFKNDHCQTNPCLNGGRCIVTYNLTDVDHYRCICTDLYEGYHCQLLKGVVNIKLLLSSKSALQTSDVVATTVFYNDYDNRSLRFIVRRQQVYSRFLSELKPVYTGKLDTYAPPITVLKVYGQNYRHEEPKYYLLYYHLEQKEI